MAMGKWAVAAFVIAGIVALDVRAQACSNRGDLDARFCDEDRNLIADTPKDPKQRQNPSTLVFSYTPVEDPAVYDNVFDEFMAHPAKVTGKKVVFFPVQSNAAQLEAMRGGRLHVAGFNTGGNPIAVACAGFVPFAIMASHDNKFGYEMEIITYPGSGIENVADIKGKKLAFTSETSNAGYKAATALLREQFKLENLVSWSSYRRSAGCIIATSEGLPERSSSRATTLPITTEGLGGRSPLRLFQGRFWFQATEGLW